MGIIIWVLFLIALDQISKYGIASRLALTEELPLIGRFFSLTHLHNRGAAWGFLHGSVIGFYGLTLFSGLISAGLVIWIRRLHLLRLRLALGMILAGSLGNLLDRLFRGFVVDFLLFHFGSYSFPAFNVADACICAGAALLFFFLVSSRDAWNDFFSEEPPHA